MRHPRRSETRTWEQPAGCKKSYLAITSSNNYLRKVLDSKRESSLCAVGATSTAAGRSFKKRHCRDDSSPIPAQGSIRSVTDGDMLGSFPTCTAEVARRTKYDPLMEAGAGTTKELHSLGRNSGATETVVIRTRCIVNQFMTFGPVFIHSGRNG